jgi:hypothetical protein
MRINGRPSLADLAKTAAAESTGSHSHGDYGEHDHGPPSYTDEQVAFLESKGYHVDRAEGAVYSSDGSRETSLHVASLLHVAHEKGMLKALSPAEENPFLKGASEPGAATPVVQHLDLRQQP